MYIYVCLCFCGERSRMLHRVCWLKSFGLKCRSMIWNKWVEGSHCLCSPAKGRTSCQWLRNVFLQWDELCCSAAAHGSVFAAALCRACRSVIPVRWLSRGHCGHFGFVVAGPPCSSAKTSTMQVSSGAFIRIQRKGWSNSFFRFALRVSSLKRHGPTCLQHTNRFYIALHIICELSTTFIHDLSHFRYKFGIWCVNFSLYPWFSHAYCIVKMWVQVHSHFANSVFSRPCGGREKWPTAGADATHAFHHAPERENVTVPSPPEFLKKERDASTMPQTTQTPSTKSSCSHSSCVHPPGEPSNVSNVWSDVVREREVMEPI